MRECQLSKSSKAAATVAVILTACGGAPPHAGPSTPPAPATWSYEFPSSGEPDPVYLPFQVSLIDRPIRIWFYKSASGEFVRVRVVGHGTEEACREASRALRRAVLDPAVAGFLGYGVAELTPPAVNAGAEFDARVRALHEQLAAIASVHIHDVQLIDVTGDTDARFVTDPDLPALSELTIALADSIPATEGPAFVPARSWIDGQVRAIELVVSAKELGLDDKLFDRIAGAVGIAPWIDAVTIAKQRLASAEAYATWVRTGARLDPSIGGINTRQATHAYTVDAARTEVEAATELARKVRDTAASIDLYERALEWTFVTSDSLVGVTTQANRVIAHNEECLRLIARRASCEFYYEVDIEPPPKELADLMARLVTEAKTNGAKRSPEIVAQARAEVAAATSELANVRRLGRNVHVHDRERIIDALLRSWPMSTDSDADDAKVDDIIAHQVPRVWKRLLGELATNGVTMSTSTDGGDLVGPSVFYRVTDRGDGTFSIVPTYIVHGSYLERWSHSRNSVVIARIHE